jgi:hypothetical protein
MIIPKETDIKQDEQNNNQTNKEKKEEKKEVIPQIPQIEPNLNNNNIDFMNELYNFEEIPKQFFCDICNKTIDEKDKIDHLLCHNLQKEQENAINNNRNNDLYGFSQKEIEEQRKIERQLERNKRKNELNRNIRENNNNHNPNNNVNNNLRNNLNNHNNNRIHRNDNIHIRSNINNNNNNYHRNYPNNRSNSNNQINNGPVITIRQTGQNGNVITTRIEPYQSFDVIERPNIGNIHNLPRRRHIFHRIENIYQDILNDQHQIPRPTDKQLFNEFPEIKIEDVNKLDQEKRNCVICLEDFKSGEKATLLPCVHIFHKNCIKNWLKSKNSCPICKFELTRENINKQNNKF